MKKVLSLVLAAMLVVGMVSVVSAAGKETGYDYIIGYSASGSRAYTTGSWDYSDGKDNEVRPGDEFEKTFWILVKNNNGSPLWDGTYRPATKKEIKDDKVSVKVKTSEGGKVLDSYSIKYAKADGSSTEYAHIKVKFIDPYVSTSDQDFTFVLYLTLDKSRDTSTEFDFTGTFANETQEAYEDDDYAYTYDVPVVEAQDYIKNIQVEIGQGVSIYTKMFEDRKYYGYCTQDIKPEDDEILAQYPEIDTVYYLNTINLNSAGNTVVIDVDDRMYVYNSNLEYIGTTNDVLPYSTKYYVSTVMLDVAYEPDDTFEPDDLNPIPELNPDMGGDDVPSNVNDNPGTGR